MAGVVVIHDFTGMSHDLRNQADWLAGKASSLPRPDLATVEWDLDQFQQGMRSELEHGRIDPDTDITDDDLLTTAKMALAHLNEIPDYYTRLAAMEAEAFDEQQRSAR